MYMVFCYDGQYTGSKYSYYDMKNRGDEVRDQLSHKEREMCGRSSYEYMSDASGIK